VDVPKIEDLSAAIKAIRDRVAARYPVNDGKTGLVLVDLEAVHKARDIAETKVAAIGVLNPRAPGLLNDVIQFFKRLATRALNWMFRGQIEFNRASTNSTQALLDALNDFNRLAVDLSTRIEQLKSRIEVCEQQAYQNADIESHWLQWRREWEHRLATNEIQFLRGVADLEAAFHQRTVQMDQSMREQVKAQHSDFEGALARYSADIQKRLWEDFRQARLDTERLIHSELRLLRQKMTAGPVSVTPSPTPQPVPGSSPAPEPADSIAFAARFRGPEDYVREEFKAYAGAYRGAKNVLDIGCGRGEFLELMRDAGVDAVGIDGSAEAVALCRAKGLNVIQADLFDYLASPETPAYDGIFCAQVVEHLPPDLLPELMRLVAAKLNPGGIVMFETPNPECLAIFATHFYIDPTHTRPAPAQLLGFYLEEAGLGEIKVTYRQTAIPETAGLPEEFRKKFFNGYDYVIAARRP